MPYVLGRACACFAAIAIFLLPIGNSFAADPIAKLNNMVINSSFMDKALKKAGIDPKSKEAKLAKSIANDGLGTGDHSNIQKRINSYCSNKKSINTSNMRQTQPNTKYDKHIVVTSVKVIQNNYAGWLQQWKPEKSELFDVFKEQYPARYKIIHLMFKEASGQHFKHIENTFEPPYVKQKTVDDGVIFRGFDRFTTYESYILFRKNGQVICVTSLDDSAVIVGTNYEDFPVDYFKEVLLNGFGFSLFKYGTNGSPRAREKAVDDMIRLLGNTNI